MIGVRYTNQVRARGVNKRKWYLICKYKIINSFNDIVVISNNYFYYFAAAPRHQIQFAPEHSMWHGSGPNNSIDNKNNNNNNTYSVLTYLYTHRNCSTNIIYLSLSLDQQVRHGYVGISIVKDDFAGHVWSIGIQCVCRQSGRTISIYDIRPVNRWHAPLLRRRQQQLQTYPCPAPTCALHVSGLLRGRWRVL